jgi:hypothetical protein
LSNGLGLGAAALSPGSVTVHSAPAGGSCAVPALCCAKLNRCERTGEQLVAHDGALADASVEVVAELRLSLMRRIAERRTTRRDLQPRLAVTIQILDTATVDPTVRP